MIRNLIIFTVSLPLIAAFTVTNPTSTRTLAPRSTATVLQMSAENQNQKKKKKRAFTINENLVGSISSDGVFEGRKTIERPQSSKLGVSTKSKKKNQSGGNNPMSKKEKQRTGNGQIDSTLSTRIAAPELEEIQVVEGKRGNKVVTIVR